jgi:DNA-binding protein Fis
MEKNDEYKNLDKINLVPPGLHDKVFEFLAHIEVAEEAPVLITGDSGVGKSLFLNILKKQSGDIIIVNCAHFSSELAASELFGHIKGAFTGAITNNIGLLGRANNMTLVLDEIGELPFDVQGKLLMFLEDGNYYEVGSNKLKAAKVKIVGVTSRKEQLREDFRNRFFEFSIPPLYLRRVDVLYYIAAFSPVMIKSLSTSRVLSLLAYNWPGNVREIKNIILSIKRKKKKAELMESPDRDEFIRSIEEDESLSHLAKMMLLNPVEEEDFSEIDLGFSEPSCYDVEGTPTLTGHLAWELLNSDVDTSKLQEKLKFFSVGIPELISSTAFKDFDIRQFSEDYWDYMHTGDDHFKEKIGKKYGIKFLYDYSPFSNTLRGFLMFCSLFFQSPKVNKNCLDITEPNYNIYYNPSSSTYPEPNFNSYYSPISPAYKELNVELYNSIFEFLSGIRLPPQINLATSDPIKRGQALSDLVASYPQNKFLNSLAKNVILPQINSKQQTDIWSMTFQELESYYFEGLINMSGRNKRKASEKAGLKYQTFNSRLRKLKQEKYI